MSIFRETFHPNISSSLTHRQNAMVNRTTNNIQYLNSRNSWIKMQSSVNVDGKDDLAKAYVLQGGTLNGGKLRAGLGSKGTEAYSTQTPQGVDYRLGIRPMPGITGIDVKSKSAYGSLREVTVNFQCWDIHQLEDLELLYMRPGYTVLIEWGWAPHLDVKGVYQPNFTDFYDILNKGITERSKIFKELYDTSIKHGGNYDAMFGYIKNYSWSAREDGGYDCQTIIISTGEIIESLKINYLKSNLADYKLYDTGSIGNGLLNDLFVKQGNTPSTKFADHYEKNILAGTWAELAYKLKDPNSEILKSPITLYSADKAIIEMPGLVNNGDSTSMIDPGSKYQAYITLNTVFNVLNKFIIAKDSSGEPLITLSIRHNNYDGSSIMGSELLCIAHPLQISTDPSVCIIKNPLWEDLLGNVVAKTAVIKTAAQTEGDAIVQALIDASEGTGVKVGDFISAIQRIINGGIYQIVDDIIKNGFYSDGTTSINRSGVIWTFSTGLVGLLQEQFVDKDTDLPKVVITVFGGNKSVDDTPNKLRALWPLYQIQQSLKNKAGVELKIPLTANSTTVASVADINDLFKGIPPDPYFTNIPSLVNQKDSTSSPYIVPTRDTSGKTLYLIGTLSTVNSSSPQTAATVSIVFSAEDAKAMITNINKGCAREYFYNGQYTEIGILGNIYVNLDFLYRLATSGQIESQDSKEKNEINVYAYIKNIASGINNSLGSAANLEIHVDPIDNVGRIIDVNYTDPDKTTKANLFELQVQNLKSVVRSYSLQSKIFPNQSAIIAIGSQAKGGQLGTQNNTMVDFNKTLTDRVISKKADDSGNNTNTQAKPTVANSLAGIITLYALCHQDSKGGSAYADTVSKCKNALRDIITYFQSLFESSGSNRNIIPAKFSFEMDGIGGLVIGQLFTLNSGILPKGYKGGGGIGSTLAQTITGISHKVGGSDWTTTIDALNVILDKKSGTLANSKAILKAIVDNIVQVAIDRANAITVPLSPLSPPSPPIGGGGGAISDFDLFFYLSWQQGASGAAQHYSLWKGNGKVTKYGIPPENIYQNWPAATGTKTGNPSGGFKSAKGYDASNVIPLYNSNQQLLAEAFIDVQRQLYAKKVAAGTNLINSSGKNPTGVPYATIKAAFVKYQRADIGLTAQSLTNFATIENGLKTDTLTNAPYRTMFQMNYSDPNFKPIIDSLTKLPGSTASRTDYSTIDSLVQQLVPVAIGIFNDFKKKSGFV
jgi:hypothetical protein